MSELQPLIALAADTRCSWHLNAYPIIEKVKSAPRWPDLTGAYEFEVLTGQRIELEFEIPAPAGQPQALLDGYWRAEVFGWREPLSWVLVLDQVQFRGDAMQVTTRDAEGNRTMPPVLELFSQHPDNAGLALRLTPLVVSADGALVAEGGGE